MRNVILGALTACSLVGCINDTAFQPLTNEQREFIYDYKVPGKTKGELFKNARNYLATAYGDSKAIGRVEDESEGLIIAKAVTVWQMNTGMVAVSCVSGYDISFIAKDERARLQLTINKALQSTPECGWKEPSKQGYPEVVSNLNATAKQLGEALEGRSTIDKLKDF